MSENNEQLGMAIDRLYSVFSSYPLRRVMDACPCCVTEERRSMLYKSPLRTLAADDLSHYEFKAMTTWGDADDFRHFLPRLMELKAMQAASGFIDTLLFRKLRYAGWRSWPREEQQAIEIYLLALGDTVLSAGRTATDALTYLEALAICGVDSSKFLARWRNLIGIEDGAVFQIQYTVETGVPKSFHKEFPTAAAVLETWLWDPSLEDRLIDLSLTTKDPTVAYCAATCADALKALRP